jgi:hypothetical protein
MLVELLQVRESWASFGCRLDCEVNVNEKLVPARNERTRLWTREALPRLPRMQTYGVYAE